MVETAVSPHAKSKPFNEGIRAHPYKWEISTLKGEIKKIYIYITGVYIYVHVCIYSLYVCVCKRKENRL